MNFRCKLRNKVIDCSQCVYVGILWQTLLASSSQSCGPRMHKFCSKSQWSLNFVRWGLMFVYPQYGTCCMSPFGDWNFGVTPRFVENMRTSDVDHISNVGLISYNKRDVLNSQIYFWNRTLHVSDRFSVHHQESSTVYTGIGICHTGFAVYTVLKLLIMERKPVRNMWNSIPKNKFEKLVHLVGFIVRIYHGAWSYDCHKWG
jgi:hypothetical protein